MDFAHRREPARILAAILSAFIRGRQPERGLVGSLAVPALLR